jgi:hypothetical protein
MSAGSNALKKFYYETTVLRNSGPIPSQAAFDQQACFVAHDAAVEIVNSYCAQAVATSSSRYDRIGNSTLLVPFKVPVL